MRMRTLPACCQGFNIVDCIYTVSPQKNEDTKQTVQKEYNIALSYLKRDLG